MANIQEWVKENPEKARAAVTKPKRTLQRKALARLTTQTRKLAKEIELTRDAGRGLTHAFLVEEDSAHPGKMRYILMLEKLYAEVMSGGRNSVAAFRALDERAFGRREEQDKSKQGISVALSSSTFISDAMRSSSSSGELEASVTLPIAPPDGGGMNGNPSPDHTRDSQNQSEAQSKRVTGLPVDPSLLPTIDI
jgi:hypothetical protein